MATTAGDFSFDVFLSHNSRDKPRVRELALALTGRGLRVWLDETELTPGRPWQQLLEQGIKASRAVIVTFGESDLGPWEEPEMRAALRLAARDGRSVIPVLLPGAPSESELPLFLQSYNWVDLRDGISETGLDRLEWGITGVKPAAGVPLPVAKKPLKRTVRLPWLIGTFLVVTVALAVFVWRSSALDTVCLMVVDTNSKPVAGVRISPAGRGDTLDTTNREGKTRLSLPSATVAGEWVTLSIIPASEGTQPEWVFISPWDGRVRVPPFDDRADNYAPIVLGRRHDRDLLTSGEALQAIIRRILEELEQRRSKWVTEAERQQVLDEQAAALGLEPADVDLAIRALRESSEDSFEKGLAALYEEQFSTASQHFESARAAARKKREEGMREEIEAARYLGQSLREQGKYRESAERYREAVALQADDPDLLKGLCWSLALAGGPVEAEAHCRMALGLYRRDFGEEHPFTARAMNSLAMTLFNQAVLADDQQARFSEAESLLRQGQLIAESALGPNHPDVAIFLNNLTHLLMLSNRLDEAELLILRALAIDKRAFGTDHPNVARDLGTLGQLLLAMNRLDEAESLLRQALTIDEKWLGPDHCDFAIDLDNLVRVLRAKNRFEEAEPLQRRAIAIFTASLGEDHRWTKEAQGNLNELLAAKSNSPSENLEIVQGKKQLISGSLQLSKEVEVRGHVLDVDGRPAAGVRVWIAGYSEKFVESDENGSFTLSAQAVEGEEVHLLAARQSAPAEDFWILAGGPAVPLMLRTP